MAIIPRSVLCAAVLLGAVSEASAAQRTDLAYLAVTDGYWEVWLSRADGSQAHQLTHSKSDKTRVSWYPDGTALLVDGNDGAVVKVDLQGREARIPLEQYPVIDAVLSPDGQRIAYSFSTAIDGNDIWIANSDGTDAEKIIKMTKLQHEPAWSPDGQQIYFLSGDGGQAHDIWRLSLQSRSTEQLTVGNLYHFDVAVSSMGDIAFSSNRSGNYEMYLQRPGGKAEPLTNDPSLDAKPTFSPDGKYLIFESTRGGVPNLWRIDLQSSAVSQITHHADGARAPAWYQGSRP